MITNLHLKGRVVLLGFVKDAPQYFGAFDIFIHSSQSEALAFAVLEAGCAALPTIATKVGGIPEIIEDGLNGLLVPMRDPVSLTCAIESFYGDREKARSLGVALRMRVERDFTKNRMASETLALYR